MMLVEFNFFQQHGQFEHINAEKRLNFHWVQGIVFIVNFCSVCYAHCVKNLTWCVIEMNASRAEHDACIY